MKRTVLSDEQWARIAPLLPGKEGDPGRSGEDNRLFLEAVLWIVRAGAPWRDLPPQFGKWSSGIDGSIAPNESRTHAITDQSIILNTADHACS